ncbi:MAG: hypothetical protein AAFR74_02815 [Pseudomonadota bacterium]
MEVETSYIILIYSFTAVLLLGLIVISAAICVALGKIFTTFGIDDAPDGNRKQQDVPVSRLGGAAILTTLLLTGPIALFWSAELSIASLPVLLFVAAMFLIGLGDDIFTLPSLPKLALALAACVASVLLGLTPESLPTPFGKITLFIILFTGSVVWLLVFTNAANFMDGVNGLAIGSLAIMLAGLALLGMSDSPSALAVLWLPLFGAIIGFLIHNLRGKLYAGDAGSLGLGALFASLGLVSGVQVWTVATLALPFLIDVLMTLIWRAKHGRPWLKPHLDHAYQKLRLSGWSHIETAFLYWGLSTVCAVAAVIAAKADGDAPFFVFCGLCLSGIILWSVHRRGHPAQV